MNVLSRALLTGFGAGAFSVVVVRLLIAGLSGAVIAAILAMAIILAVGIYYDKNVQSEERQTAGDNLYYLGLLFTLLSLILALIQLFVMDPGSAVDERAYELIGNFGVALLSTVAGILARILLHSGITERGLESEAEVHGLSFRSDIAAGDLPTGTLALRDDLAELRRVLREATDAFSHFNRVTATQSEEAMAHTDSVMRGFTEGMVSAVSAQLDQATAKMQSATETLRSQSDGLTSHFERVVSAFNSNLTAAAQRGMQDTGAAWQQAASEMQADGQKQIERLYGDINKLVSTTESAWNEMTVLSQRIASVGHEVNAQASEFRKMAHKSADASRGISLFIEQIDNAQQRLRATADAAENAARSATDSARKIGRLEGSLESDLNRIGDTALERYEAAARELSTHAREQLDADGKEWLERAESTMGALHRHRDAMSKNLTLAQHLSEQISEEASQWQKLAEKTRRSLVDAIDRLAERVTNG